MSTSIVSTHNLIIINPRLNSNNVSRSSSVRRRHVFVGNRVNENALIPKAKSRRQKSWWEKFFFNDDGNWLGLRDDDMVEYEEEIESLSSDDGEVVSSDVEKFEAWKRRVEAIVELREAQNDMRNEESRRWEDWLVDDGGDNGSVGSWSGRSGNGGGNGNENGNVNGGNSREEVRLDVSKKGFVDLVSGRILGRQDDEDMLYEDRVFQYASVNSAKFLAVLIIIPWALDFVVHDYVLMPFLERYVKTVPLAAQMLDVRRYQKLEMIKELKVERARFRFEEEIGKSPPLSDDEVWLELRHKALEMRDEWRLENRRAFANIWSDMVFGITLFLLLFFNQNRVALLKFTGYKILDNISDTGKAFLIILITDIFLGYHSESGWQTLLEIVVEHYGFEVDSSAITIFVCLIPVVIDACVKLWLFKFLPRLSPRVANIFQEMKRH